MGRYSPSERSLTHDEQSKLTRVHTLLACAINIMLDARKEMADCHLRGSKCQDMAVAIFRLAKEIEAAEVDVTELIAELPNLKRVK